VRRLLITGCLFVAILAGAVRPAAATAEPPDAAIAGMVRGLRLVNWFPSQGPHDRMWTAFDPAAVDRDFATIAGMHANAVRVIPDVKAFTMPSPPVRYLDELSRTVALAARHGLRVQLTLFDQFGDYTRIDDSRRWAEAMLSRFRGDPRIAFVELQNEIGPHSDDAMRWARDLLPHVRGLSGGIPVTVSVSMPDSSLLDLKLALGSAAPDFWDLHYYYLPGSAATALREAAAIAAPKPLLIGEAGYSTFPDNAAVPGVPRTTAAQEAYQEYLLRAVEWATIGTGLPPAAPWIVNDFPCPECVPAGCVTDCSESGCATCKPADDFYGLRRADGSAKPAAATVSGILGGAPVDLDVNLGFERAAGDDPAGWRTVDAGGATLRRDPTVSHSGSASAFIAGSDSGDGAGPCWAVQPLLSPRAGSRYRMTAWARGAAATGRTYADLVWLDYAGQPNGDSASTSLALGDTDWTRLEVSSPVPDGTVAVELRLCSAANAGSAWFDDVRIDPAG
jgi:hypothetical protein